MRFQGNLKPSVLTNLQENRFFDTFNSYELKSLKNHNIADQQSLSVTLCCSANSQPTKNNRRIKLVDYNSRFSIRAVSQFKIGLNKGTAVNCAVYAANNPQLGLQGICQAGACV